MRLLALLFPVSLLAQFDYDLKQPLHAEQQAMAERRGSRMFGGSFNGVDTQRINYVLVQTKHAGQRPGVVFQHGGGQSMSHYISEALILAEAGVTSIIPDVLGYPPKTTNQSVTDLVVNERRALDVLLEKANIDPARIAYVGHSYGGSTGGILAAVEPRFSAFVLAGAVPSLARHIRESKGSYWDPIRSDEHALAELAGVDAELYLAKTKAPIFVQCARFDTPDNVKACPDVHRAAAGPKRIEWYDDDHDFTSLEAKRDRLYWLEKQLRFKGMEKALRGILLK